MSTRCQYRHALAALLMVTLCGCSAIGMGYRANYSRDSNRREADRLTQLAEMYERQGHPSGAMRLYRQALQSNPRSQIARDRLMALSSQHAQPSPAPVSVPPTATPAPTISPSVTTTAAPLLAGVHARRPSGAAPQSLAQAVSPEVKPPLAPEPPTAAAALKPQIAATRAAPLPKADVPEPRSLPTIQVPSAMPLRSVAESAAAAALAAAAAPFGSESSSRQPEAPPVIHPTDVPAVVELSPSVSPDSTTNLLEAPLPPLELPATAAITALPTLGTEAPFTVSTNLAAEHGWTTSSPEGIPAGVLDDAAARLNVEIHPYQASSDVRETAVPDPVEWAPTDLQRTIPGASTAVLSLLRGLSSPDALVRKDALEELLQDADGARSALAVIRTLLQDPDVAVRAHSAWVICCVAGPDAESIDVLSRVLESGDAGAAPFAAYCLGQLAGDATVAIPVVRRACSSSSAAVRLCAAEALLKITPDDAEPVSVLIEGLRSPDVELRWLAALSLSAASTTFQESAILALVPALQDDHADVCSSAALALGAYGSGAQLAVPELQAALSHPDQDVRDAAAAALACIVEDGN